VPSCGLQLIIKGGSSLELNGNTGRIESIASQAKADKDFLATDESNNSRDALSIESVMQSSEFLIS
jgi:hypothetical protein